MAANPDQQNAMALHGILENTFNIADEPRRAAEEALKQAEAQPQFLWALFQVAGSNDVRLEIRQAAAIKLKNKLNARDWNKEGSNVPDEDKKKMRDNILQVIIQSPSKIRNQLLAAVHRMVLFDFPQQWPDLIDNCAAGLRADTLQSVSGSLAVLRTVCKRFEFVHDEEEQKPLLQIVDGLFPTLCALFNHVNTLPVNEETGLLQKLLAKIFWSAVHLEVPKSMVQQPGGQFKQWMECFRQVTVQPVDSTTWTASPWQAKKWVGHILTRLVDRYNSPRGLSKEEQTFQRAFVSGFATGFLHAYFGIVELYAEHKPVAPKILALSLKYVALTVPLRNTYQATASKFTWLVERVLYPLFCFNERDAEQWQENPHEYIRKLHDPMEDMFSPRSAAVEVLRKLVKPEKAYHHKDGLAQVLVFLNGKLNEYKANPTMLREKDGCLYMIGQLKSFIKRKEPYCNQIEALLCEHVLPEFENPTSFIREKAVWAASCYSKIEWKSVDNYAKLFGGTMKLMKDPELPVRAQAGMALKFVVLWTGGTELVLKELKNLIHELFKLFAEVDCDELIGTLEVLIERFGEALVDNAADIFNALATHCKSILPEMANSDDDGKDGLAYNGVYTEDDASAMASSACIRTMYAVLEAVSDHKEVFPKLEPTVIALCDMLLVPSRAEFIEETLELLAHYFYLLEGVPQSMWHMFPRVYIAYTEYAQDAFSSMLNVLDNFITLGSETFCSGTVTNINHPGVMNKRYVELLLNMLTKVLEDEENHYDLPVVPKLISAMLQHCKDCWPDKANWVPSFYDIILRTLQKQHNDMSVGSKILCISVIADGLYFDVPLTMTYLKEKHLMQAVFDEWLALIPKIRRRYDMKVTTLGLTAIFEAICQHGVDCMQPRDYFTDEKLLILFGCAVQLTLSCHQLALEDDAEDDEEEEDDDSLFSGNADDILDEQSDPDDIDNEADIESGLVFDNAEEKAHFNSLIAEANNEFLTLEDLDDDEGYTSVIDKIEEAVYLFGIYQRLHTAVPPLGAALEQQIKPDAKQKLQAAVEYGQKKMQERAAKEAAATNNQRQCA